MALPAGVSLDGNGRTISLAGDPERFESAGIHVRGAAVRNLTIDGHDLAPSCPAYLAALVISGASQVEKTTVRGIRLGEACAAAAGIEVGVFDGERVDLVDVSVSGIDGAGIFLTGDGLVTITDTKVADANTGVQVMNTIEVSIAGSAITGSDGDISVTGAGMATVGNLTIVQFGRQDEPARGRHRGNLPRPGISPSPIATARAARVHPFPSARTP